MSKKYPKVSQKFLARQPIIMGYIANKLWLYSHYTLATYSEKKQLLAIQPRNFGYIARNCWQYSQQFLAIQPELDSQARLYGKELDSQQSLAIQPLAIQPEISGYIAAWLYSQRFLAIQPEILGYIAIGQIAKNLWLYSQELDNL